MDMLFPDELETSMKTTKVLFGILTITLEQLTQSQGQGSGNLLTNPSFEQNAGHAIPIGWARFAPPTAQTFGDYWIENSPPVAHTGDLYWKEWGASYGGSNNVAGIYQVLSSAPGSVYAGSGWFYVNPTDVLGQSSFAWVEVAFLDSTSNILAIYKSDNFSASIGTGTWFQYQISNACDVTQPISLGDPYFTNSFAVTGAVTQLVAPVGTTAVRYQFCYLQGVTLGTSDGGSCYFDDADLEQVSTLPPTPPNINAQPQPVTVNAYDAASFSVTATGTPPLRFQWSLNGSNIAEASSSSLTISNVTQTNLGAYSVVVTNDLGSATSSDAMLSMYPFIVTPFTGAITYWGKDATFSVGAWGTGPLSYQWFDNGVAIQNATNQTLTLTDILAVN
ncbi:hypothetical protein SBV1_770001 [Verrucomicrobia bacterium]|nr:hypothetical protein SBV1_770001 [Verrucomicrobiota bacterium]